MKKVKSKKVKFSKKIKDLENFHEFNPLITPLLEKVPYSLKLSPKKSPQKEPSTKIQMQGKLTGREKLQLVSCFNTKHESLKLWKSGCRACPQKPAHTVGLILLQICKW